MGIRLVNKENDLKYLRLYKKHKGRATWWMKRYNKALCQKYPFLLPRSALTGEAIMDYDYSWTVADDLLTGWRISFGIDLFEALRKDLIRNNDLYRYYPTEVKEKWGELRWYDNGVVGGSKIPQILDDYMYISRKTCIECGRPAGWMSKGWISPYCKECAEKSLESILEKTKSDLTPEEAFKRYFEPIDDIYEN